MLGGTHTTESKLAGIDIQTSLLGTPISLGWGRAKVGCNLIDYVGFKAIPKTTKTGGKGGSSSTTYTYTASPIMLLCEGSIQSVRTVYRDASVLSLTAAGLSLATGTLTQSVWGYLTSLFPSHAVEYSSLAFVYAQDYPLGNSASLANHSFEVDFAVQMAGLADADPKDIATDFLTNVSYGVTGWKSGLIGSWAIWSLYCRAANLLLSPTLDAQASGADFLARIAEQSNSEFFWSEGVLKCKPYGDTAVTGNSVTWTPDLTPQYDLDEDDFIGDVIMEIVDQTDAYNYVTIEFLDRTNQYEPAPMPAQDLDNIITYGLRKRDAKTMHDVKLASVAQTLAQIELQKSLYIRETFRFTLPEDFVLLEPMDYVTLTTTVDGLKLNRQLVLIKEIVEDEVGNLSFVASIVPGLTASAAAYAAHTSAGNQPAVDVDPGNIVTPRIFNAPTSLATVDHEVWCAVAGGVNWGGAFVWISADNVTYAQIGIIRGPARYGVLTAALANATDPDTTNTLSVNLTTSLGALGTATHAEADAGASMCLVGAELLAFADQTLTSAYNYNLTYLRRGLRGTPPSAHSIGDTFIRIDDALFKFAYDPANSGGTIYLKFQSFNRYGRAVQDLAGVTAYSLGLAVAVTLPDAPASIGLAGGGSTWTGAAINLMCADSARATSYQFDVYKSDGTTFLCSLVSATAQAVYTAAQAASYGPQRAYKIKVKALNAAGSSAYTSMLDVTNAAPAAVSGASASGGATSGSVSCTASGDADLGGYVVFYSGTSGFDANVTGGAVVSGITTLSIFGLAAATYYARIAAYDLWTGKPSLLNLSAELSFTITTGGGSTPSGGGTSGGGYIGSKNNTAIP